jgi:hypothetical protein
VQRPPASIASKEQREGFLFGRLMGALVSIGLRNDYPIRGLVLASGYYFPTSRWDVWIMSGPAIDSRDNES